MFYFKHVMNLKYMKVSLFEISFKKNELFHDILIYWDAPVIKYIKQKTLPSVNGRRPGPTDSCPCTFTSHYCRRLRIQYVFPHVWCKPVLYYCLLRSCKTSKQHSLCIELIQRPESSLRRHKLGLPDQSIRSNDDKTRFTCVHKQQDIPKTYAEKCLMM